jgi:hypothetical protein
MVELGGGEGQATENFEPLESLWWQSHCYGEAPSSGTDMIDKQRARGIARSQAACDKLLPVREAWVSWCRFRIKLLRSGGPTRKFLNHSTPDELSSDIGQAWVSSA